VEKQTVDHFYVNINNMSQAEDAAANKNRWH